MGVELATDRVGTGRVALPLLQAGVRVDGIEQSQHMVDRMREKPRGESVHVVIGDMARVDMGRKYGLVYLVYNTIGNLLTQDDQVRCFENAARHLTDDGVFVLECRVPTAPKRPGFQFVDAERLAADRVTLDLGRYDPVSQLLDEVHVDISDNGISFGPISLRLAHPPEFDLMARIAGLRLRQRAGGWHGEPFIADSWRHVSVYERAASATAEWAATSTVPDFGEQPQASRRGSAGVSSPRAEKAVTVPGVEDLLRRVAPEVLGALARRYGRFDLAEDAVQEALLAGERTAATPTG